MIRFQHNENDQVFRQSVVPEIRKLMQQANVGRQLLQQSNSIYGQEQDLVYRHQSHLFSSRMGLEKLTGKSADQQGDTSTGWGTHSKEHVLSAAHVVSNRLHLTDFSPLFPNVRPALPGTCDWLLDIEIFKNWVSSPKDGILFIRGGQGQGKSVLSQFITQYVKSKHADDETIIVRFFCKTAQRRSSPVSILQHILYHICQEHAESLMQVAEERTILLGASFDLNFYWDLLLRAKMSLKFSLICVIDGLDEIITDAREDSERNIDFDLVDFLEEMCTRFNCDGEPTPGRMRLLFTTRPIKELEQATSTFGEVVLNLRRDDLERGVSQMVDVDLKALAATKGLSPQVEALISHEVKKGAGPMFQWAHAILKDLRRLTFNVNALEGYRKYLERFRPEEIDDTYKETLRSIRDDASISEADQMLLRLLIHIVVFAEEDLRIQDMQYALACTSSTIVPQNFPSQIPQALETRIKTTCGSILDIDQGSIRLAHQSVGTFLRQKVPVDLSMFDCKHEKKGNLVMAQICLHYLRLHPKLEPTATPLSDSPGELFRARLGLPFVAYASVYWTDHVRKCGALKPKSRIWALLATFLSDENAAFTNMVLARLVLNPSFETDNEDASSDYIDEQIENVLSCPMSIFLAENDLLDIYKLCAAKVPFYKKFQRSKYQKLIRSNFRCNTGKMNLKRQTALHFAASNGSIEFVRFLLEEGASGQIWDSVGITPFYNALDNVHPRTAEMMLTTKQAYQEKPNKERISSMQRASYHGMVELVTKMVAQGFPIDDEQGLLGWTPLYVASRYDVVDMARLLLRLGADPSLKMNNSFRDTPLHAVALCGSISPTG